MVLNKRSATAELAIKRLGKIVISIYNDLISCFRGSEVQAKVVH